MHRCLIALAEEEKKGIVICSYAAVDGENIILKSWLIILR